MKTSVVRALGLFALAICKVGLAAMNEPIVSFSFSGSLQPICISTVVSTATDVLLVDDLRGEPNSAGSFDGSTSYISVTGVPVPETNAFSWALWVKPSNLSADRPLIERVSGIGGDYLSPSVFCNPSGALRFGSYGSVGTSIETPNETIKPGQWTHVAVTSAADGTRKIYINGVKVVEGASTEYGQSCNLVLIGRDRFDGRNFPGRMDEVRIYDRTLSAGEVEDLYSSQLSTVTGVLPVSGPATGGTSVIINGTNFPQNPAVLIGGSAATNVVRVTANRITAVTPAGLPGMTSVAVGNWVQPNAFYYRPECGSDLDQDGEVTAADIAIVLLDFGPCYATATSTQPEDSTPFMLREQADSAAPRSR
jgi:hypothetical protein